MVSFVTEVSLLVVAETTWPVFYAARSRFNPPCRVILGRATLPAHRSTVFLVFSRDVLQSSAHRLEHVFIFIFGIRYNCGWKILLTRGWITSVVRVFCLLMSFSVDPEKWIKETPQGKKYFSYFFIVAVQSDSAHYDFNQPKGRFTIEEDWMSIKSWDMKQETHNIIEFRKIVVVHV